MYFGWVCPKCGHDNENTVEDIMENNTICQSCYEEFDISVSVDIIVHSVESVKDKQKERLMKKLFG